VTGLLGLLAGVLLYSYLRPSPFSIRYLGVTNDYYAAFQVINLTHKTVVYAGGLAELRTAAGWQRAPERFRHIPAPLISLGGTGTVLVAIPKSPSPWRTRLRFESLERTPMGKFINFLRYELRLPIETYSVLSEEIQK
jgi:hypothetical protein